MDELQALLERRVFEQTLVKIVFSKPREKSLPYKKVSFRPITLRGETVYQAEYHYEKKVVHKNLGAAGFAGECLPPGLRDFKRINIFTETEDIQVLASKADSPKIIRARGTMTRKTPRHNEDKNYIIPDGQPCDFLIRLGVMDADGTVFPRSYSKFRQINRFLEIVRDVLPHLKDSRPLRVIDFGCGKAYLSFALYYYLNTIHRIDAEITGLDLKSDVIDFCGRAARDLNYRGLRFLVGDIADYKIGAADYKNDAADYKNDAADLVVTLHACDTATDFALINAVKWNAKVILSVPCCQHELFSRIESPLHEPLFKHGIIKDRFTALLTDGLRGLKLESAGYEVAMIEFTGLEHTSKNIMIKAVKTEKKNERAAGEYDALKRFYSVNPAIDVL